MTVARVLLAEPRGFCAGVEMAIKALSWMVEAFDPPVYCYHEIVHNQLVVDRFREQGVVFVDDVDDVPAGAPLMLSAHGSAPEVVAAARDDDRVVVNAVCPLVTKVHHEARVRAGKGYTILYVGHEGHDEAEGALAVAPDAMRLVEHESDLARVLPTVDDPSKVALLAQTTLSMDDWNGVLTSAREHFPELWTASRDDLCFATTNRQRALRRARRTRGRDRGDRQRELVEHDRAHQGRRARLVASAYYASTDPRSSTATRSATRASWASPPVPARRKTSCRRSSPSSPPPRASRWCTSPTRTSTSLPRPSSASCRRSSTNAHAEPHRRHIVAKVSATATALNAACATMPGPSRS